MELSNQVILILTSQEKLLFPIQNLDSLPSKGAAAVCHSRMFLSGIHNHKIIDSGQKNAGMTDF